tara:strand:+ start:272 stop:487 length:216 start_codon:yes stop_codon:yes gene_type:complete
MEMETLRRRTANDRPSALDAKYDPKEFLDEYDVEGVIRKIQDERGLEAGERAMKGSVGREINAPERVANYM